jgi:hypothetical protein
VRHDRERRLILNECWNVFGDCQGVQAKRKRPTSPGASPPWPIRLVLRDRDDARERIRSAERWPAAAVILEVAAGRG